jgi:ABC-type multidrug transport system fused ATPase/permease subunit
MKMMSVKESDVGWSWFAFFFIFHFVTAIGTAAISTQLWESSSAALLFCFWLFAFLAIITFCMFLASIFSKATRAGMITLLVFFVGYFLTLAVDYQNSSIGIVVLVSLHPVGALAFGLQEIGRLEDSGTGITAASILETDSPSGYTFANTLLNLLFDSIVWGVASWYSNRVSKADYGQPLPWYFPFTLSYWSPGSKSVSSCDDSEIKHTEDVAIEPVSSALREQAANGKGIEIRNLNKAFGEKTAVDDLKMNLYPGQITALLGHNGAGTRCSFHCRCCNCIRKITQSHSLFFMVSRKNNYYFDAYWNAGTNFGLCNHWRERH